MDYGIYSFQRLSDLIWLCDVAPHDFSFPFKPPDTLSISDSIQIEHAYLEVVVQKGFTDGYA